MPIYMQVDGIKSVTLKPTGAVGIMLGDGSVRHLFGPKQRGMHDGEFQEGEFVDW